MPKNCLLWARRYIAQHYPRTTPQNYQLWKDAQRMYALPFKNNKKKHKTKQKMLHQAQHIFEAGNKNSTHWYFRYLKLRYAAGAQFRLSVIHLSNSKLERALLHPTHTRLTSAFYHQLLDGQCPSLLLKVQTWWQADISDITTENCQEVFSSYSYMVILARDNMIQLRYLHRMYYTLQLLFRMYKRDTPICHKCSTHSGDFLHMVWDCDRVRPF